MEYEEVGGLPVLPITLKKGDVLLYYGSTSIVSRLIRLIQGNKVTHCAVVIAEDTLDKVSIAETDAGVPVRVITALESWRDAVDKNSNIKVKVVRNYDLEPTKRATPLIVPVHTNYGYVKIGNAMINHLIGRTLGFLGVQYKYKDWIRTHKDICSTLTSFVLHQLFNNYSYDEYAEPDDFTTGNWTVVVADLGNEFNHHY